MRTARIASPEALGGVLREARLARGLSQRQLADHLGLSQRYVVELERGKDVKAMQRLFDFMQETGVSLYGEVDDD